MFALYLNEKKSDMSLFKKDKRFRLTNGKTKNSYGFVVDTAGIDTARFEANPVLLDNHYNSNQSVLGYWDDIKVDLKNNEITAKPVFDEDDENAKKIAGKVDKGFIRGASIGVNFNRKDLKMVNGIPTLTKCELLEASICAIPSNANAITLFSDGQKMNDKEVQSLCLSLNTNTNKSNIKTMDKEQIQLSLTAAACLGFEANQLERITSSDVNLAITRLHDELKQANEKITNFETAEKTRKEAEEQALKLKIENLVDNAVKAGKIKADEREHYLKMAAFDYAMCEKQLEGLNGKGSLSAKVNTIGGNALTMDEFQKLTLEQQLQYKSENPTGYASLTKK